MKALLLLAALALPHTGQAEALSIGVSGPYPPFQMRGDAGQIVGLDADLMAEICQRGGFSCTWREIPMARLFDALQAGQIDVAVGGLGRTPERSARVHMTCPYRISDNAKGTFFVTDPAVDPKAVPVAVTAGALYQSVLQAEGYTLRLFDDEDVALSALLAGTVPAFFGSAYHVHETPGTQHLLNKGTLPLPTGGTSIAVTRQRDGLAARIDELLAEISRDGRLADIQDLWLGTNQGDTIKRCRTPALTS